MMYKIYIKRIAASLKSVQHKTFFFSLFNQEASAKQFAGHLIKKVYDSSSSWRSFCFILSVNTQSFSTCGFFIRP